MFKKNYYWYVTSDTEENSPEKHNFKIAKGKGWKISLLERNYSLFIIFRSSCLNKRVVMLSANRCCMQIYFLQLARYCKLVIVAV